MNIGIINTRCYIQSFDRFRSTQHRYLLREREYSKALFFQLAHTIPNIAPTMSEFMQTLEKAAQAIRQEPQIITKDKPKNQHKASIAILAGVDLFMRFVTRNSHDFSVRMLLLFFFLCLLKLTNKHTLCSSLKRQAVLKILKKTYYPEPL
jgi:hypothetical protein